MPFPTVTVLTFMCVSVSFSQSFQIRRCGQTEVLALTGDKISQQAKAHSLPFVVSLVRRYKPGLKGHHFCGGTLLQVKDNLEQTDIVLTAASCGKKGKRFWSNINEGDFYVVAGGHNLSQKAEGQVKMKAKFFVPHGLFHKNAGANDIAIVKLKHPINFTENIQPACLPKHTDPRYFSKLIVAGWGSERKGVKGKKANYEDLHQNILPLTEWANCEHAYELRTAGRGYCATTKKDADQTCEGDLGGGAFTGSPSPGSTYAAYILQGIGHKPYGCFEPTNPDCHVENSQCYKYAGAYTNVTPFMGWINQTIYDLTEL